MKDDVAAVDQLGEQRLVVDRVDEVLESRPPLQVRDVVDRSGRQVVEDQHVVSAREQSLRQMRTDEAGAAGDQRTHAVCPFLNDAIADATSSTSPSPSAGESGNDSTWSHARSACGHWAGAAAASAGCRGIGTG